jgi:hypothetical protein
MLIDGVSYEINWRGFKLGASFFVPCIHKDTAKEEIKTVTRRLGYKVVMKLVIEEGIRGLRVWRIR